MRKGKGEDMAVQYSLFFIQRFKGKVLFNVPMSEYTSIKIGGPADVMAFPQDEGDLKDILAFAEAKSFPFYILGGGTNLLVRDGGIRSIVINMSEGFKDIVWKDETNASVGSGVRLAELLFQCRERGLTGFEFASGIPGTIGGAVMMNAGAYGGEMKDCAILTPAEVQAIHQTARAFDQRAAKSAAAKSTIKNTGNSPGSQFNQAHQVADILTAQGWKPDRQTTAGQGWTRPGKKNGTSGVLLEKTGNFFCWSNNAYPLEAGRSYDAFGLYTMYEHNGDFSAAAKELARAGYGTEQISQEWQEPVSLDLPELPPFTEEDFPPGLWAMVAAVSKSLETPPELAGMLGLAVLATACQKRVVIQPEPGYREPLNVWTLTALDPGNRKSAGLKAMASPLIAWEIDQARAMGDFIKSAQLLRESEETRIKELQRQFARESDPDRRLGISQEMIATNQALAEIPVQPQLFVQDVTPERLGTLLALHGERMGAFSAEGGIFDIISGRYSNAMPNLDIFLQSHSGDAVRVDRGSRPSVWLQEPSLTMGLAPQPEIIKGLASKPGFKGRGLIGRFLFALPRSPLGSRKLETIPVPPHIAMQYATTIRALLDMHLELTEQGELQAIVLTDEAWAEWKAFARWVETGLADGGEFSHMRDWGGKLPGAAARIAGLFHCYSHAGSRPHQYKLNIETMNWALSLSRKLSRHAIEAYDVMAADPEIEGARKVLHWIATTGVESFTLRDCHYALKGTFRKRAELDPAIQILSERCYVRRAAMPEKRSAGRPSEAFNVNPAVIKRGFSGTV